MDTWDYFEGYIQVESDMSAYGPILAMVGLTFLVMLYMYARRIPAMIKMDMDPEVMKDDRSAKDRLPAPARYASDNLINLFEVPVLFYVISFAAIWSGYADGVHISLAWVYVWLRALHSFVQCAYNRVIHRFAVFAASSLVLMAQFMVLVVRLLSA